MSPSPQPQIQNGAPPGSASDAGNNLSTEGTVNKVPLVVGLCLGLGGTVILAVVLIIFCKKRKSRRHQGRQDDAEVPDSVQGFQLADNSAPQSRGGTAAGDADSTTIDHSKTERAGADSGGYWGMWQGHREEAVTQQDTKMPPRF